MATGRCYWPEVPDVEPADDGGFEGAVGAVEGAGAGVAGFDFSPSEEGLSPDEEPDSEAAAESFFSAAL